MHGDRHPLASHSYQRFAQLGIIGGLGKQYALTCVINAFLICDRHATSSRNPHTPQATVKTLLLVAVCLECDSQQKKSGHFTRKLGRNARNEGTTELYDTETEPIESKIKLQVPTEAPKGKTPAMRNWPGFHSLGCQTAALDFELSGISLHANSLETTKKPR